MAELFTRCSTVAADGTTIAYRFRPGKATGQSPSPMLAVPGLGMPAEIWFPTVAALQAERSIAIIDPRGSGLSDPIQGEVDGGTFAADAVAVMDHLGWPDAHVAGISMGSMIAQHLAVRHRERVRSLTLVCSYARPGPWTSHVWKLRLALTERGDVDLARLAAALFLTAPHTVDEDQGVIDRLMMMWASSPLAPESYLSQMRFCASHDLYDELALLTKHRPVGALVVDAHRDLLCPSTTSRVLADLLSARLLEFPTETHLLASERPIELAEGIDQHLARFEPTA